jgi:hypothetical protein
MNPCLLRMNRTRGTLMFPRSRHDRDEKYNCEGKYHQQSDNHHENYYASASVRGFLVANRLIDVNLGVASEVSRQLDVLESKLRVPISASYRSDNTFAIWSTIRLWECTRSYKSRKTCKFLTLSSLLSTSGAISFTTHLV